MAAERAGGTTRALRRWIAANRTMLGTTSALAGSTLATSLLGFVFWSAAARLFPPDAVGLASAGVSGMTLLGTIGMVGLGTLMIGELPRRPGERGPLLATALATAAAASLLLWGVVVVAAPGVGDGDAPSLLRHPLFAAGVALTAAGQVLDQSLIGLLRGNLQLWRNLAFAAVKLAALLAIGLGVTAAGASHVVASWTVGLVASFVLVAALLAREGTRFAHRPDPRLLRRLGGEGLKHHVLNLALYGPRLLLPVLATVLVSADANAAFYAAWMLVSFGFMVPAHFSTVLHALGAGDAGRLAERLRTSLRLSLLLGLVAVVGLLLVAPLLLRIFGAFYAEQATVTLRILALVIPAMTLKLHLVAVERVRDRVGRTALLALLMSGGAILEIGLAALGATLAGIAGLAIGFVTAVALQAVPCVPPLLRTLRGAP